MTFTVIATGPQALLQDLGRGDYAAMGVTASGAFDRAALRRGNRILGNLEDTAGLEVLIGGLQLRADDTHTVCVTGAVGPADVDGRPIPHEQPITVTRGQTFSLGTVVIGMRSYVAVSGGWDAAAVLGSKSTDTLAHLGPRPAAVGDCLPVGRTRRMGTGGGEPDSRLGVGDLAMRIVLGPHTDWFDTGAISALLGESWTAGLQSNRVGIRLDGPVLSRVIARELPPTPCLRGAIQITANGQPIVFGPDHPVTGGYPVIATVIDADTDMLGQMRPGQAVHFLRHRV